MDIDAENYYQILGVTPDARDEDVKQAFRDLAKHYHPDRNPGDAAAERRFKQVNAAYEALKDASRRKAYDEWLAFAEKRQNAKKRQWGRLAALLALLLFGPAVILSWVALSSGSGDVERAATSLPAPPAAVNVSPPRESARAESPSREQPGDKAIEETVAEADVKTSRSGDGASLADEQRELASAPAGPASTAQPEEPAEADDSTASAPADPRSETGTNPAVEPADRQDAPDTTQAIPQTAAAPEDRDDEPDQAAEDIAAADPPVPIRRSRDEFAADAPGPEEDGALSAARRLAALKEPEGASPQDRANGDEDLDLLPPHRRQSYSGANESFSDCDTCPLMSMARRSPAARGGETLAISASEVTLSQWNACVEDGVCPPYQSPVRDPSAAVVGVSEIDAGLYVEWLSEVTGKAYRVVMPFSPRQARREAASGSEDCDNRPRRRGEAGWDWLDDRSPGDCPPASAGQARANGSKGFRVARRVRVGG